MVIRTAIDKFLKCGNLLEGFARALSGACPELVEEACPELVEGSLP